MENLKITANLGSPMSGDPPFLDALLIWVLTYKMKTLKNKKFLKSTPLENFPYIPIPLENYCYGGKEMFKCSNPIYRIETEWFDKQAYHFESDKLGLYISPEKRKMINIGGGHYKSRFASLHIKLVYKIVWFAKGNRKEVDRLLRDVKTLGFHRKIGYGLVLNFEVEEIKKDNSIYVRYDNKKILMKSLPNIEKKDFSGFHYSFGAVNSPYWHPQNQIEIIEPN